MIKNQILYNYVEKIDDWLMSFRDVIYKIVALKVLFNAYSNSIIVFIIIKILFANPIIIKLFGLKNKSHQLIRYCAK